MNDRNTPHRDGLLFPVPVAAATEIFGGHIIAANAGGYAVPATATAAQITLGVSDSWVDNREGANGGVDALLRRGREGSGCRQRWRLGSDLRRNTVLVNAKVVKAIFVNLKTTFQNAFTQTPSDWKKVAMVVPSTGKENDYSWLSRFPKMREWVGDKVIKSLAAFNYTLRNKDWEATVEVDRNDIEDDQLMGYAIQAQSAGQSAAELPADIVFALVSDGFTNLCYDGQPFFDTDHPVKGKSVSNKGTKKLSTASLAAAQASYGAARKALRSMKDEEGASLKILPGLLVVPPALEDEANYLMTADRFPDNTPNPYKGTAEVLVVPELKTDTEWFLFDISKPVKPIIYQERKKPDFVEQTDYSNDNVFMRKTFRFGAEARANGGYAFWQMAYGSTGEVA